MRVPSGLSASPPWVPPALTHTTTPGWIQQEAGSAGAQVAAPGVHAIRVLAQAQGQALVDICRVGGDDQVTPDPGLMEGRGRGRVLL